MTKSCILLMMKITLTEEGFGKDFAAKNVAVSLWLACLCVSVVVAPVLHLAA